MSVKLTIHDINIHFHWSSVILIYQFYRNIPFLITIIVLHELGHLLSARYYGEKVNDIHIVGFGGYVVIQIN